MAKSTRKVLLIGIEILSPVILFAVWWVVSDSAKSAFFPSLGTILEHFQEIWLFDHFMSDIVPSLTNLSIGYLLAVFLGVASGLVLGSSRTLVWFVNPLVNFWRSIPPVALVPIFIAMFGFGSGTRVLSITLAALFPTMIATIDGMRGLDSITRDVTRIFKISRFDQLVRVNLPAASPIIFAGMQVSLQNAFVVMIGSEMLGVSVGIGAVTLYAQQTFKAADMWTGILLLGIIGYLVNLLFDAVRKFTLRWYYRSQRQGALS